MLAEALFAALFFSMSAPTSIVVHLLLVKMLGRGIGSLVLTGGIAAIITSYQITVSYRISNNEPLTLSWTLMFYKGPILIAFFVGILAGSIVYLFRKDTSQ
ncbi:hypothetical protein J2D73_10175 [Acetobacter sacchari]|uniref:Uncharacterized protein n=1 Tax=Acetobacter sacchari TaxID=2661687 RepID=A0ABS3LW84_9PROT|nr:hypothetical protein [Acetobacter sacchari]MBO1360164.1 hypothetical protein [Acetobacter sacchari]